MSSLAPLQQLRRLDKLSPQFPDQLTGLLREQGYKDHTVTSLQDEDLSWLVEYLDDVRPRVAFHKLIAEACLGSRCSPPHQLCVPESST